MFALYGRLYRLDRCRKIDRKLFGKNLSDDRFWGFKKIINQLIDKQKTKFLTLFPNVKIESVKDKRTLN